MIPGDESRRAEAHHFLSLAERGALYHIPLPARRFVGSSSDGAWLVSVARSGEVFLLNPFSRAQARLPPLFTLPGVRGFTRSAPVVGDVSAYHCELREEGDLADVGWNYMSLRFVMKVSAWVAPPSNGRACMLIPEDYAAVAIHGEGTRLAFCRAGDESWTAMEGTSCPYADVVRFQGRFHAVGAGGVVHAWDGGGAGPPRPAAVAPRLPCLRCRCRYLVVWSGPRGEHLLQVLMVAGRDDLRPVRFHVFRLQAAAGGGEGDRRWVEVRSLGADWALFLCRGRSACTAVRGFPELRGDCVYFVDDVSPWLTAVQGKGCRMGEYRLGGGGGDCVAWYSVSVWPPPMWFLPHLPELEE